MAKGKLADSGSEEDNLEIAWVALFFLVGGAFSAWEIRKARGGGNS
ncbi:hypothetical protein HZF08_06795 [Paenibacillus sp. CGMCC 1.16610]|uniref:Uncharacterized protein n=1 Tax=Paenibacillus anseongense TaxID=2682845 RepID=A0ABW9UAV4_9BACL|nr:MULTISPECIES: hypothetical protein [Paenibacillus]MBA2938010.1 hypothetical protein [Paenibacillus sp. CGMCC 1.16610]MVQ37068.1 hypothetical protein [Paenibacillus anseongense]